MNVVEFTEGSLRFLDALPEQAPADGFVWAYLDRAEWGLQELPLQAAAQRLGGSALLDLHAQDLASDAHPSHYDGTSIYDLVIFRRLANPEEVHEDAAGQPADRSRLAANGMPEAFARINSRAVGFAVFDRLLISVHPPGCTIAKLYVQRFLADVRQSVESAAARSRLPASPTDLTLRMINTMVDSYLDLRKDLTHYLEQLQAQLMEPTAKFADWSALMKVRGQLHLLEDLCEEQQDAMQEWLDSLREQPAAAPAPDSAQTQGRREQVIARARDVMEHIDRVLHHARRLEQSAETVVQIHFSAQGHRTNDIMRTLTAITAVFLPLNLITGFFGMNFEFLPLIHSTRGMWFIMGAMVAVAVTLVVVFWRKRYLARTRN